MDAPIDTNTLIAGSALAAWGLARFGADVYGGLRRRREQIQRRLQQKRALAQEIATVAAQARARQHRGLAWEGLRPLRVAAIVDESSDIKSFYLTAENARPLPSFLPGQYLTLHLPGPTADKPVVRCYSLSDRPRDEFYRISVKREAPPGRPAGVASSYLHAKVKVGDVLQAKAPRGAFFLHADRPAPVCLVAAGIGVTPLLAMLLDLERQPSPRDVYFFLGVAHRGAHPFKVLLEEIAERCPRLRLFIAYSRPSEESVFGRDYQHSGRLNIDYLRSALPSSHFEFYLCGPAGMMQSLVTGLEAWGVSPASIHYEAFGPATVQRAGAAARPGVGARVRFARSHREAVWGAEDRSLLELAERAGVPIESGCRTGACGACATPIVSGQVTPTKPAGAEPPRGCCLACISVPSGPVVLDV